MAEELNNMKEAAIYEFLRKIDFKRDKWTIQSLKEGLQRALGEKPGVDIGWLKTMRITESGGEPVPVEVPTSITIYYTTDDVSGKKVHSGNVTVMI